MLYYFSQKFTTYDYRCLRFHVVKDHNSNDKYVTNLGWFGQFHTKSSVWLHGQLLLLKSLVRSLPATLYTFYTILNMLSEWFKPTRSGSMVLSGHGKWLCSYIPRQLGSRTLVAGLWSGRVRGRDSLVIWISSQTQQKYTVVYSGLIRSLLATSHTNPTGIETSDGRSGYRGQYPPPRLALRPDGSPALA